MKRIAIALVLAVLVLAGAGLGVFYYVGLEGSTGIERWIGREIQKIAEAYLNPRVEFEDLDYTYPRTVVVRDFRMTAADPDAAGETVEVLFVEKLQIELAEIPKDGQPIKIEQLIFTRPRLQIIATGAPGAEEPADAETLVVGFTNLVKQQAQEAATSPDEPVLLSDRFEIRLLELIEGEIVYDDRRDDSPAMKLDGINSKMDVVQDAAGKYQLSAKLNREPVLELAAAGRLDINNGVLEVDKLDGSAKVASEHDSFLPPGLQSLLRQHQVTGQLFVEVRSARIPFSNPAATSLESTLRMADAHFVYGEYRGQADSVSGNVSMADGVLHLKDFKAITMGGEVTGQADIGIRQGGQMDLTVRLSGVRLEQTLRAFEEDPNAKPKYRGVLSAYTRITGPVDRMDTQAGGVGNLQLREGAIDHLPLLSTLAQAVTKAFSLVLGDGSSTQDRMNLTWDYRGNKMHFTKLDARTPTWAVRGNGDYYFEDRLDLYLNGGPLEKIQSMLGKVGELLGKVTDQLITYHVTGSASDPKVTPVPFRIIKFE